MLLSLCRHLAKRNVAIPSLRHIKPMGIQIKIVAGRSAPNRTKTFLNPDNGAVRLEYGGRVFNIEDYKDRVIESQIRRISALGTTRNLEMAVFMKRNWYWRRSD